MSLTAIETHLSMFLCLNKGPVVVHNRNLALSGIEKQESFNMRK